MKDTSIIPAHTKIGDVLRRAVSDRRIVFIAGLPSSGKSLFLQQLTILARQAGRNLHLMQWDSTRLCFEKSPWLGRYPEVNNLTHPGIRKAVGLWVRGAINNWHQKNVDAANLLIAELPVVGGRFAELLVPLDDEAEPLLAGPDCAFVVPIPTMEMRKIITGHRAETFSNPRNEQETKDAPIHIVENDWVTARRLHNRWTGTADNLQADRQYDPVIYAQVFERLGRFRHLEILSVDRVFETGGSVYERPVPVTELLPTEQEVAIAFEQLEKLYPGDLAEKATDNWADY